MVRFSDAFAACGFQRQSFYPAYGLAEATLKVSCAAAGAELQDFSADPALLESGKAVEISSPERAARSVVCCGAPAAGMDVAIVDPASHTQLQERQIGEIWVSVASVAGGYWNLPKDTERLFRARLPESGEKNYLRTGDLGFMSAGALYITGRLKDLIIIRGRNHYPQDIERTVEESHRALRAGGGAAFSITAEREERLVIVQEAKRGQNAAAEEIAREIHKAVAEAHELEIHALVLVRSGTIPKTSSGKIQRAECRKRYLAGSLNVVWQWQRAQDFDEGRLAAPETFTADGISEWLIKVMSRQSGMQVSLKDLEKPVVWFGLGSLHLVELSHEIERAMGVKIPLDAFLEEISLAGLVEKVLTLRSREQEQPAALPQKRETEIEFPLSQGQEGLWFLYRFAPQSAAYNIARAIRLAGEMDASRTQQGWEALAARHPMLRAVIALQGDRAVHRIGELAPGWIQFVDAAGWSEAEIKGYVDDESQKPFVLEQGPLFKVLIIQQSPEQNVMLLIVHHIISDYWSLALLLREFPQFYSEASSGRAFDPDVSRSEYADYVEQQAMMLAGAEGRRHREYWEQELAGPLECLDLNTDYPRPPQQSFHGASISFTVNRRLAQKLAHLARSTNTTLYALLASAFKVLLWRYTGQREVLLGSATAGRNSASWAGVTGYFVNTIVLRAELSSQEGFDDVLLKVKKKIVGGIAHQDYPFTLVVDHIHPERDPSRSPVFQAMFNWQSGYNQGQDSFTALALGWPGEPIRLAGFKAESFALEQRYTQFDLTLTAGEISRGRFGCVLEYARAYSLRKLRSRWREIMSSF